MSPTLRIRSVATARRAGVRVLTHALRVPVVRPFARLAMRALFDTLAPQWQQIRRDPAYVEGFVHALDMIESGATPRRILDVACGAGLATSLLVSRYPDADVIGCDISPQMIQRAVEAVPEAFFVTAPAHSLPAADGSINLVTSLDGVFDLHEIVRVLTPDGVLLVVYSHGGTTPVSIPLGSLAARCERLGLTTELDSSGTSAVLVARNAAA